MLAPKSEEITLLTIEQIQSMKPEDLRHYLELVISENKVLCKEIDMLKQRKEIEQSEEIIRLKEENVQLIHEYEELLGKKLEEIKQLRTQSGKTDNDKGDILSRTESILKQEISHLNNINSNALHELKMKEEIIKGMRTRESSLIADKQTSLTLLDQEWRDKLKKASLDYVILQEENRALYSKVAILEKNIDNLRSMADEDSYKQLYEREKKNCEKLNTIYKSKMTELEDYVRVFHNIALNAESNQSRLEYGQ